MIDPYATQLKNCAVFPISVYDRLITSHIFQKGKKSMSPENFKSMRNALGLSQRATSRLLGMAPNGWRNVQRWEAGEQDIPWWATYTLESLNNGAPLSDLPENCPDHILQAVNIMITGELPDIKRQSQ